jgi:hypothetical protein
MMALAYSERRRRWRVCSSCALWQGKSMAGALEKNREKKGESTTGGDCENREIRQ